MTSLIISIVFLICITVIVFEIAFTKNCGNCKHQNECWVKIDAETYRHSCEKHEKIVVTK